MTTTGADHGIDQGTPALVRHRSGGGVVAALRRAALAALLAVAGAGPLAGQVAPEDHYNRGSSMPWLNDHLQRIDLGHAAPSPEGFERAAEPFCRSAEDATRIWGRGHETPGVYFDEPLPGYFRRRLQLTEFSPGAGAVQWLFTGERGGFTVTFGADSVRVVQRHYDSYGLNELRGDSALVRRHPEQPWVEAAVSYTGALSSVTVEVDHRLRLRLLLNDSLVAEQLLLLDVTRHQLRAPGAQRVCGTLERPVGRSVRVVADESRQHQEILGFGGIASPPAYRRMSEEGQAEWWRLLREYNLLIQREYPIGQKLKPDYSNWDDPAYAVAHYYGDNFPNGEISNFDYNRRIYELGGQVIFEFWQFPLWAVHPAPDPRNAPPIYERYTEAVVNYLRTSKQRTGFVPQIVGIQNEVRQPDTVWHQMTLQLREALNRNGFGEVKIHMHNAPRVWRGIEALRAFRADSAVWNRIDFTATNMYDYQEYFSDPDGFDAWIAEWSALAAGKPFLSTELAVNQPIWQVSSYRAALAMGQLYHKNFVMMDASAIMYCWVLLDSVQRSYDATRSLFTLDESRNFTPKPSSYQLRVLGAYSRHALPGMRRIAVESGSPDLLATGFAGQGRRTLVLFNRSTAPAEVDAGAAWPGAIFTGVEITSPYDENRALGLPTPGRLMVEPGQIITLFQQP